MQRIIITGTGGRLGAALARRLRDRHRVVAWDRRAVDLSIPEQLEDHLRGTAYDVLINCAALTSVDQCEMEPELARSVNETAPGIMAAHSRAIGARMIQISTDYVYDGTAPGLRTEADATGPLGVYGRTKLAGEAAVLAQDARFLAARVSWVFGPDRESFVDSIIRRAVESTAAGAISDKFSTPSFSHDLSDMLERLLAVPDACGALNLCNEGTCSWQEYGQAALDLAHMVGVPLQCRTLDAQRLADMVSFKAQRPVHTAMSTARYTALTGHTPRHWRLALQEYIATYYAGGSFEM